MLKGSRIDSVCIIDIKGLERYMYNTVTLDIAVDASCSMIDISPCKFRISIFESERVALIEVCLHVGDRKILQVSKCFLHIETRKRP